MKTKIKLVVNYDMTQAPANREVLVWDNIGKPAIARRCEVTGNPIYAQAGRWYSHGLLIEPAAWAELPQLKR